MKYYNEMTAALVSFGMAVAAVAADEVSKSATAPAAPAGIVQNKPAAEKQVAQSKPENEVDEIGIEDFDDSAMAAKGRPVVKLAPQPAAKEEAKKGGADGEVGKEQAAVSETKAPAPLTGAEIAAKYLASNESALVDIASDDATLTDILRQFRKATGANIIYAESSNLLQRVSVSLQRVPWLKAMGSILNSRGFRVESSGGIHFVKEDKLVDPILTRSFLLNHASAEELAKLFNDSYGVKSSDGKLTRGVATAFQGANTVVVTANERTLADCEKIVNAVDKAVPQIYIEARFIELSNQSMHKLGMQWNQLESWGASVKDVSAGMAYSNGRLNRFYQGKESHYYTPKQMQNIGTDANPNYQDMADGRSRKDYDILNYLAGDKAETMNYGDTSQLRDLAWRNNRVFSGQLSADDFYLAMSAFEKLEDARIFSNPKIIVSNGKEALVDMTTKYPNITISSQHDTQSGYVKSDAKLEVIPGEDNLFAKTAFYSWGITLTVKPRISPDGLISVEIVPSISELDRDVTPTGFYQISGGTDSPYGSYPIIKFKRLTTDFTMKDGATAVIGGLSKTEEGDIDSGIPYLRDIPWVGNKLFGWKSRGKVQKEIVVFVTVGIADPANLPEDVGLPKNAIRGREYVEKRALEPGDRPNAAAKIHDLDMRPMDVQQKDVAQPQAEKKDDAAQSSTRGKVTITPVPMSEQE